MVLTLGTTISPEQKSVLQKMLSAKDNAYYASALSGHIEDLENAGIVHDTTGDSLVRRYVIDLKVCEYLKKHPNLLSVEQ